MGQIRKVGDTYYIEFYARGLMYSKIAGSDLAAAQKLLEETEKMIAGGEALTVVRRIDLPVFFDQFIGYARKEFGPKSAARFQALIEHFQKFLKRQYPNLDQLAEITPSVLEAYKASRLASTKPHLVNFSILLLKDMLDYGIKIGFINDNPSAHVRLLKSPSRTLPPTARGRLARELLAKGTGLGKASKLLRLSDVGRMMHYANLIPLSREDMYN